MHQAKLIAIFYKILFKSKMEYRFNFFFEIFINFFTYIVMYMSIWILLGRFKQINGWSYYEVILLYNLNLMTYGIACIFFYIPMRKLESIVQTGEFDSYLIRPLNPFIYLMLRTHYLGFLSHIILGLIVFVLCFVHLQLTWNITTAMTFLSFIMGGVLIQSSVLIGTGALNIRTVKANALMDTIIYNTRSFIEYPISIYPQLIQGLLTFIIPYAFVNYYPAKWLLGKSDVRFSMLAMQMLPVAVGVMLFVLAYVFWTSSVRCYTSTGS